MVSPLAFGRQHDGESRAAAFAAVDLDSTVMLRHNLLYKCESNSGAFLFYGLVTPYSIESLKDLPLFGGRYSRSPIHNRNANIVALVGGTQRNRGPLRTVLDGVREQVIDGERQ